MNSRKPLPLRAGRAAFLFCAALAAGIMPRVQAEEPARDSELVRQAETLVASDDPVARQLALLEVASPDLVRELVRTEKNVAVRRAAILMLTDQAELQRLAVAPATAVREVAVVGIADESFLLARLRCGGEPSPTVRKAIVQVCGPKAQSPRPRRRPTIVISARRRRNG